MLERLSRMTPCQSEYLHDRYTEGAVGYELTSNGVTRHNTVIAKDV